MRKFYICLGTSYPQLAAQIAALKPLGFPSDFKSGVEHWDVYLDNVSKRHAKKSEPRRKALRQMLAQMRAGEDVAISEPRILGGAEAISAGHLQLLADRGVGLTVASMNGETIEMTDEVRKILLVQAEAGHQGKGAKQKAIKRKMASTGKKAGRPREHDDQTLGVLRLVWLTHGGDLAELEKRAKAATGREWTRWQLYDFNERRKWPKRGSQPHLIPRGMTDAEWLKRVRAGDVPQSRRKAKP